MSPSDKISRRAFAGLAAGAVLLPSSAQSASRSASRPIPRTLLKPPRLHAGDVIGLVAPGGRINDEAITYAVGRIEALGFRARLSKNLRAAHGGYAGAVQQRVDDLHAMFSDREVKAIWCVRGGSGCISLLAHIDYALIRANPKILLGYSDISALQLAILKQARLVTFHGPVALSGPSDYAVEHMLAVLMHPQDSYTIPMALENSRRALLEPHFSLRTVTSGQATGPLIGGNLSLVSALMGTPYAADFRKAILFLEEVNEAPYRIDRWLTQLDLAVGLRHAAAVMIGICDKCGPEDEEPSLTLDETLDLHLKPLVIPAVSGYSFGHIRHQFTLPLGVMARLDTARQTVTLLEPAVS